MKKNTLILLFIIIAIASFFRLWQLDLIPPGLYPDEAMNANDALDTLESKQFKLFYPENNGREGLHIWILSFSFALLGPSIWALKIVSSLFGILTVLGLYLLTKELFKDKNIALLASFFLSVSFWHVNFSRIGFRAIIIPFILVFGFYFLIKAFKDWKTHNFILSGILFGLGFYTYISYRFIVIILLIFLGLKLIEHLNPVRDSGDNKKIRTKFISNGVKRTNPKYTWSYFWKKVYIQGKWWKVDLLFILAIFLVALPIGIYFLYNPGDFFGRAAGVSVLKADSPGYELGKSIIAHLSMFNLYGDANWRHNLSTSPQILWMIGIFFLIGLAISIKRKHVFLLSWFFVMLLPGFLSAEGIPHALRVIGVIPVVYIFSALGAYWVFKEIKTFFKTKYQIIFLYLLIFLFLTSIAYAQFNKYFYEWAENPNLEGAFSKNYVKIGQYLNSLPDDISKYVIVNQGGVCVPYPDGIPMPAQTSIFIERTANKHSTYLLPENLKQIKIDKKGVIIPLQYDENLFLQISNLFPEGNLQEVDNIWVYKVNVQ